MCIATKQNYVTVRKFKTKLNVYKNNGISQNVKSKRAIKIIFRTSLKFCLFAIVLKTDIHQTKRRYVYLLIDWLEKKNKKDTSKDN